MSNAIKKAQQQAQKKAAKVVAKAASDGKIKASELQQARLLYGQAAVAQAVAQAAAANSSLSIGKGAKELTGISTKGGTISYTPDTWQTNAYNPNGGLMRVTADTSVLGPQFVSNAAGGYTYMGSGQAQAAPVAPTQNPAPGGTTPPPDESKDWSDSIDAGTKAILEALNKTLEDNRTNQGLYMGIINDLVGQMNTANQQVFSGPYAVTTATSAPVQGAQTTQAIARRLRNANTSLAIAPAETVSAGAGLNIAV